MTERGHVGVFLAVGSILFPDLVPVTQMGTLCQNSWSSTPMICILFLYACYTSIKRKE